MIELLRVLLKIRCEEHEVAQKLVASADDLELIAADDGAEVPALHGWRREVFGDDALALKHGRLALTVAGRRVKVQSRSSRRFADRRIASDPRASSAASRSRIQATC